MLPARRPDCIYLTGFMGSGKTTVGPILANTLGFEFFDIDKMIERRTGTTVVDIFLTRGEPLFRAVEREVLHELSERSSCVVSLGGGTMANEENFQFIRKHGIIVYLELSEAEIVKRVRHRPDRPLLHDQKGGLLSGEKLEEKVRFLLKEREPFYRMSDIIVPSHARTVGYTVDAIVRSLRNFR
jgi:shikimate kinase